MMDARLIRFELVAHAALLLVAARSPMPGAIELSKRTRSCQRMTPARHCRSTSLIRAWIVFNSSPPNARTIPNLPSGVSIAVLLLN